MIQIYSADNANYEQNGDMTLFPSSATVKAVINGSWEITLDHPKDTEGRWKYIKEGAVVKMPSFNGEQLFRITHKEKNDSGISADLQPIFMDAKDDCFLIDIRPTDKTGQQALNLMTAPNKKYTAVSDIITVSTAYYQNKNLIEAINGDDDNAFIKRWGGEIVYDNYTAIVNKQAGGDYGVEIIYGKNVADNGMKEEVDLRSVVTRLVPKAYNGYQIAGDKPWVDSPLIDKYPTIKYGVLTFENVKMRADAKEDDEKNGIIVCDTQAQLDAALKKRCKEQWEAGLDKPKVTISVDMVMIEDTELYADVKGLVQVSLGDTVHCRNSELDIVSDARVVEITWDCVNNQIESVELGDFQFDYLSNQRGLNNRIESAIRDDGTVIGSQIQGIIDAVKAQFHAMRDVAKKQDVRAMLFEDLDSKSPTYGAMCLGTMGFEIASKRTADGRDWDWKTFGTGKGFFADYIVAGTMLADRIRGGQLTLGGLSNVSGVLKLLDASGNILATMDCNGIDVRKGNIQGANLILGGKDNVSGKATIKDAAGNVIATWDCNGIDVKKGNIQGTNLILGGKDNISGKLIIKDAAGNIAATLDNSGIIIDKGIIKGASISINDKFMVNTEGYMTAKNGKISIWSFSEELFQTSDYKMQFVKQSDGTWNISNREGSIGVKSAVVTDKASVDKLSVTSHVDYAGYEGKSGRVEFSDGTYINIKNGGIIGGSTKEGTF